MSLLPRSLPLSVIILTLNEEEFIARCVGSVPWADEVLVLDSGSTDRTREIARGLGATVYEQPWLGWSQQHTQAISLARHDWVLCIDCDEIVTPELAQSIAEAMQREMHPEDGYYVDRRGDFLGALLPNEQRPAKRRRAVRLFHRRCSAYDPQMRVHEEVHVSGHRIALTGVLLHWRGYTIDEYIPVFNRYATVEAEILRDAGTRATGALIFWRPLLRFLWCYVYKQEFRLGTRGLIHAGLKAVSEYIRYAKLWEMQNAPRTLHPPAGLLPGAADAAPASSPQEAAR